MDQARTVGTYSPKWGGGEEVHSYFYFNYNFLNYDCVITLNEGTRLLDIVPEFVNVPNKLST